MANSGFSKKARLLGANEFEAVFSRNQTRVSNRYFLFLALNNEKSSRLGIVVAKKNIATAVQRNRIKRLIRESFRNSTEKPENRDVVVLVRKNADKLSNSEILLNLNRLWQDLASRSHESSSKVNQKNRD